MDWMACGLLKVKDIFTISKCKYMKIKINDIIFANRKKIEKNGKNLIFVIITTRYAFFAVINILCG